MIWYKASMGNLVIEEGTGNNIAVVYNKKNAPIIAAAPELLEACKALVLEAEGNFADLVPSTILAVVDEIVKPAIIKATR